MSTTWQNWVLSLISNPFRTAFRTRRTTRRQWPAVEGLEDRALLSASIGGAVLDAPPTSQSAEVVVLNEANLDQQQAVQDVDDLGSSVNALKVAPINHHKPAQLKQTANYTGGWDLGINGPPTNDNVLIVQQVGKKVVGSIVANSGSGTLATIKGRVHGDQLIARVTLAEYDAMGKIVVTKTAPNSFEGTLYITYPGQGTQFGTLVGQL